MGDVAVPYHQRQLSEVAARHGVCPSAWITEALVGPARCECSTLSPLSAPASITIKPDHELSGGGGSWCCQDYSGLVVARPRRASGWRGLPPPPALELVDPPAASRCFAARYCSAPAPAPFSIPTPAIARPERPSHKSTSPPDHRSASCTPHSPQSSCRTHPTTVDHCVPEARHSR